jgi:hypothetical protein
MNAILEQWSAEETRLEREVEKAEMQIQELKHRLERVRIAREEYERIMPAPKTRPTVTAAQPGERGEDMVLRVLRNVIPRDCEAQQVLDAMTQAGWTTDSANPLSIINTYLYRLSKAGKVERPRKGRYRAVPQPGEVLPQIVMPNND